MAVSFSSSARWPAIVSTMLLWLIAIGSIVFWGLRLSAPSDLSALPAVVSRPAPGADPAAVAQILGAVSVRPVEAPVVDAATRFVLQGVVADGEQQGAALIAVDGRPARPFRVGSTLTDGFVLQSLTTRAAAVGTSAAGAAAFTLQLPTRPLAANPPPAADPLQPSR